MPFEFDLSRRYKWIKIVLKHFNKGFEWCHSTLKYFATEHRYIIYYKVTKGSFPYESYNLQYWYVFLNISRYVHFQAMVNLWILINIKLSIDWGIKHQILRNLNFCWPENCAILNLANITWLKPISRWPKPWKSFE